jgi:predicted lipid carrier protein YhbT
MKYPLTEAQKKALPALERLLKIAQRDTGQSRRCADFLLAWHNAGENGGFDPTDLWNVDAEIADDMLTVLALIRSRRSYPDELGFEREIQLVWELWRAGRKPGC